MITKELAKFFHQQCAGEHKGHMDFIPNNPTLHGLCAAHDATTEKDFALFLKEVAGALLRD